jgi:hypothetical protein
MPIPNHLIPDFQKLIAYPPDQIQSAWMALDPDIGDPEMLESLDLDFSTSESAAIEVLALVHDDERRAGIIARLESMGVWGA